MSRCLLDPPQGWEKTTGWTWGRSTTGQLLYIVLRQQCPLWHHKGREISSLKHFVTSNRSKQTKDGLFGGKLNDPDFEKKTPQILDLKNKTELKNAAGSKCFSYLNNLVLLWSNCFGKSLSLPNLWLDWSDPGLPKKEGWLVQISSSRPCGPPAADHNAGHCG